MGFILTKALHYNCKSDFKMTSSVVLVLRFGCLARFSYYTHYLKMPQLEKKVIVVHFWPFKSRCKCCDKLLIFASNIKWQIILYIFCCLQQRIISNLGFRCMLFCWSVLSVLFVADQQLLFKWVGKGLWRYPWLHQVTCFSAKNMQTCLALQAWSAMNAMTLRSQE